MGITKSYIIVEDRLEDIFSFLPEIKAGFKNHFGYGDKKELLAFLKTKTKGATTPYPLIWLLYPYKESHTKKGVQVKNLQLILAVEGGASSQNPQRMEETFKAVLFPLLDNIIKAFTQANITNWNREFEAEKRPNYSSSEEGTAHATTFRWDALKFKTDIVINDGCLKEIKFF